jgi:hypothetical protein
MIIARGAFTREAMLHSPFHVARSQWLALIVDVIHAFDLLLHRVFIGAMATSEDSRWLADEGFPVDDRWAESEPGASNLVYANPDVRIYAFRH